MKGKLCQLGSCRSDSSYNEQVIDSKDGDRASREEKESVAQYFQIF